VIEISGQSVPMIARSTGDPSDGIAGVVFMISEAELAATDSYGVDPYSRVEVRLKSGRSAWVYIGPPLREC
jgi:hypothetical protein